MTCALRTSRAAVACAALLLLLPAAGARAQAAAAEDEAARIFDELQKGGDASALVPRLLAALDRAGLPRTSTVALAALARSGDEAARAQARAELFRRAAREPELVPLLASEEASLEDAAPAGLKARIARRHLEEALALAPPEEGTAFISAGEPAPAADPGAAGSPDAGPAEREAVPGSSIGADAGVPPEGHPKAPAPERSAAARGELARARALSAAIPAGSEASGEAREVAALSALADGDEATARRELTLLLSERDAGEGGAGAAAARRQRALLQLARLAYGRGDDASATVLYERVSRAAPEWLDALFESSWAHFRRGEDEKALGNLLTLHAPFFEGRYFPESYVLKALLLYENCRFADASRTLQQFERSYRPVHDGFAALLEQVGTPQLAAELVIAGPDAAAQRVPEAVRPELRRLLGRPELVEQGKAAAALAAELDSFDGRSAAFRSSALAQAVLPAARKARLSLIERTGRGVRARLSSARSELRELLAQSLRLSYEIAGREKELARDGSGAALAQRGRRALPQVGDDEELWPFQGEYWRDELGSYQFTLGERCRRAAPGVPARASDGAQPGAPGADAR